MRLIIIFFLIIGTSTFLKGQENGSEEEKLRKSIFFGGGSYYISDDQLIGIRLFIEKFENLENYEITISGHTDDIGGKEYNEWLSDMRSLAVKQALVRIKIPEEFIHLKKFGEDNPLYDNESWQGKLHNRRVDIILTPIVF